MNVDGSFSYSNNAYQHVYVEDASETIAVASLNTWYQITNATNDLFNDGINKNFTLRGDTLFFDITGVFNATFNVSFEGSNSDVAEVRMALFNSSDVLQSSFKIERGMSSNNTGSAGSCSIGNVTATGYYALMQVRNTGASGDITFEQIHFTIIKIDEAQ